MRIVNWGSRRRNAQVGRRKAECGMRKGEVRMGKWESEGWNAEVGMGK